MERINHGGVIRFAETVRGRPPPRRRESRRIVERAMKHRDEGCRVAGIEVALHKHFSRPANVGRTSASHRQAARKSIASGSQHSRRVHGLHDDVDLRQDVLYAVA